MALPPTAIEIDELVKLWPIAMPELKDQGEADRMNELLGNLLNRIKRSGKTVPEPVFVTDEPAGDERQALLDSDGKISPEWFAIAYGRWWRGPLFKRFWETLTDDEKRQFFTNIPR